MRDAEILLHHRAGAADFVADQAAFIGQQQIVHARAGSGSPRPRPAARSRAAAMKRRAVAAGGQRWPVRRRECCPCGQAYHDPEPSRFRADRDLGHHDLRASIAGRRGPKRRGRLTVRFVPIALFGKQNRAAPHVVKSGADASRCCRWPIDMDYPQISRREMLGPSKRRRADGERQALARQISCRGLPRAASAQSRPTRRDRPSRASRGAPALPPTALRSGGLPAASARSARRSPRNSRRCCPRCAAVRRRSWRSACAGGRGREARWRGRFPTRRGRRGRDD